MLKRLWSWLSPVFRRVMRGLRLPSTAAGVILGALTVLALGLLVVPLALSGRLLPSAWLPAMALAASGGLAIVLLYLRLIRPHMLGLLPGFLIAVVAGPPLAYAINAALGTIGLIVATWLGLTPEAGPWPSLRMLLAPFSAGAAVLVPLAIGIGLATGLFLLCLEKPASRLGRRAPLVTAVAGGPLLALALIVTLICGGGGLIAFGDLIVGGRMGSRLLTYRTNGVTVEPCLMTHPALVVDDTPIGRALVCLNGQRSRLRTLYTQQAGEMYGPLPADPSDGFTLALESYGLQESRRTGMAFLPPDQQTGQARPAVPLIQLFPFKVGRLEANYVGTVDANRMMACFQVDTFQCNYQERYELPAGQSPLTGTVLIAAEAVPLGAIPPILGAPNQLVRQVVR